MTRIPDYHRKSACFMIMVFTGGILVIAMIVWMGVLLYFSPPALFMHETVIAGVLILAAALLMIRQVTVWLVTTPLLRLCDVASRIAEGKAVEQPVQSGGLLANTTETRQLMDILVTISVLMVEKEQALEQEHHEYQNLFETVPCLITVQDKNLRLIRYNREFAEKFGPQKGDYCYKAYKGRSEKCDHCPVEKTFIDGKPHTFEEAGYNRDGRLMRWVARTAPIRNENGEVVAAMEISLDVTVKRELEEKLLASQRRYQAIFSNIPNPVFVLNPKNMKIMDCNDSVEPVYGYTKEELRGRSFLDLFEEKQRDASGSKIYLNSFLHQERQIDKNGKTLYVDIRSSMISYPGWEVLLVTTSDITQQLETEQQLIQASKMTTLGEMATGIAHELNQPLSVMKTASSFILNKYESGRDVNAETLANMLKKIDVNVDRASNIINHMRQFARKSELDLENAEVNRILQMASEIFSEQLKVRGITVNWEISESLPFIKANPSRLEQVFINILINARDAIEQKWGDERVEPEEKVIAITTGEKQKTVIVEICDTGNGIPESIIDKIFEPFYTTKSVGNGTGLGLSISYSIIKECGGTIQAVNRKTGGACFIMKFPAVYERQEET